MSDATTFTLTIQIPRTMLEEAIDGAEATVTVEAVIERLSGMHQSNLHEDIKWAVQDIAEDPTDPALLRPFRIEWMDDDPQRVGEFIIWLDDDGDQEEREGAFADEDSAISAAIAQGGRQVDENWPN